MTLRIWQHIAFWFTYVLMYVSIIVLFPAPTEENYTLPMRIGRAFVMKTAFMPWVLIPFYSLFYYLIPKYFPKEQYRKIGWFFLLLLSISILGHRAMITPMYHLMDGNAPDFNVFSFRRILYTLIDILSAVGLAASVKLLRGRMFALRKEQELREEKRIAELNFLKAQSNPHFLFNTLNNLYGLARKNNPNTAPSILKLSNLMRYILHECSSPSIPLEQEIQIIEDYISLEKLRYDDRLKLNFKQDIDDPEQSIAPLILLPFVENAFKHGAGESRFEIKINIDLRLQEGQLYFHLDNSCDEESTFDSKGIGLKNVKRQLDLIYGDQYSLDIQPGPSTFSVTLNIQLHGKQGTA